MPGIDGVLGSELVVQRDGSGRCESVDDTLLAIH